MVAIKKKKNGKQRIISKKAEFRSQIIGWFEVQSVAERLTVEIAGLGRTTVWNTLGGKVARCPRPV